MTVTIGVKALNEEAHIAAALTSALAAVAPFGGEVVLADSGSDDRTIEIARTFPAVRIVQLAHVDERCCGAGAQLAFQAARMPFFYLLDGDMVLHRDFLAQGLAFLDAHPAYAAVGGQVREVETANREFAVRAAEVERRTRLDRQRHVDVDRLDCGGLYRVAAVEAIGYFADRNLHAFEEFETGARLVTAGWRLARLPVPAVDHFGHRLSDRALLWRRLRSGYAGAPGEVVRAALGRPHWPWVLLHFGHLRHGVAVMLWWGLLALTLFAGQWIGFLLLLLLPLLFLWGRRGRLDLGLYSYLNWNIVALGLLQGIARARVVPEQPLAMRVVAEQTR